MRLTFLYLPVRDLTDAIGFYRDQLGLDESWREGEDTVAFKLPGSDVELMIDRVVEGSSLADEPGGFFEVDDLGSWIDVHPSITWVGPPFEIPGGRAATMRDPSGNTLHVFDQRAAVE